MSQDELRYWKANDKVTLVQAALLIVGADPQEWADELHNSGAGPKGFQAVYQALLDEVNSDLPIVIATSGSPPGTIDWGDGYCSTATMSDLREWVQYKGIKSTLFRLIES